LNKLILFALIPLFLSIGIEESYEYGSGQKPDARVCGDRLCTEIPGGRVAYEAEDETIQNMDESKTGKIDSPRKQMANGVVAQEVICKSGFTLMIRSSGDAACVTPSTAEKLIERGWTKILDDVSEKTINPRDIEVMARGQIPSTQCSGNAKCISGTVTKVVDGDTIHVDGQSIRFALASTPELSEFGGIEAKNFVEQLCPIGSAAIVDEDDGQTQGSYGRIIGVIYCNAVNLNEAVLDAGHAWLSSGFCSQSEFSGEAWAQKYGCSSSSSFTEPNVSVESEPSCDPSYPDVCIPPYPPDLDCGEIGYSNFRVVGSDPHGFDRDNDGIGCES